MNKGLFLALILSIFCLTFISAVPPVTTVSQFPVGYSLVESQQTLVNCTYILADSQGNIKSVIIPVYNDSKFWSVNINSNNFTKIGTYKYGLRCEDGAGGALTGSIQVSNYGSELSEGDSIIYSISLIGICLLFGICLYFSINLPFDNNRGEDFKIISINKLKYIKLILILLSYALFIWVINLLFGLSQYLLLEMYSGFFKMIFDFLINNSYIFFVMWIIIFIITIVKDFKINELLKKGFN
jgi:hypothetical protein